MATAFPLFSQRMFGALTYQWGNTLFALVAVVLLPIPFVRFTRYALELEININDQILGILLLRCKDQVTEPVFAKGYRAGHRMKYNLFHNNIGKTLRRSRF